MLGFLCFVFFFLAQRLACSRHLKIPVEWMNGCNILLLPLTFASAPFPPQNSLPSPPCLNCFLGSFKTQLRCFLCLEAWPSPERDAAPSLCPVGTWLYLSIAAITLNTVASWFVSPLDGEHLEGGDGQNCHISRSTCCMNACTHEHHNCIETVATTCWALTVFQLLS